MKLRILVAAVLASGLALISTTVSAKGLQEVTVSGPGLVSPIRFSDNFANELARRSGFFRGTADGVTAGPPAGALGPRYGATYRWNFGQGEPTFLRQDLYPFAAPGPLAFTPRGQKPFEGRLKGGWSRAGPELTMLLVAAGVPVPPTYASAVPVVQTPPVTG
jgi:hypothetical protein